jgi:hypothetical protein
MTRPIDGSLFTLAPSFAVAPAPGPARGGAGPATAAQHPWLP